MAAKDSGGQSQSQRSRQEADAETTEAAVDPEIAERHEAMTEEVDDLLDEIDEVLETNSEEFVRSFVQKGGQ
ncbi:MULTISPECIES: ubiquitin-like protein Pup [Glycomyces]|uniref:Prokaryotic ubiquitin-like protein Pup n=1 Tax=Glycomyces artemisiae TaxID=1076443 RepID=A0A2T0UEU1_9ACTN|nr:ubiquitin-like protein Pup [Glycomyces artemisiae]NUQ87863.1 ubiquitin-like protein Pup [Glycomyces artemisiae]PRY56368.1 ubiquitin-like protein Pup [Glycomyces artemisiae]